MSDGEEFSISVDPEEAEEEEESFAGATVVRTGSAGQLQDGDLPSSSTAASLATPAVAAPQSATSEPPEFSHSGEFSLGISLQDGDEDDYEDDMDKRGGLGRVVMTVDNISDPAGREFWKRQFWKVNENTRKVERRRRVGFEEFASALESHFRGYLSNEDLFEHDATAALFVIENICVFVVDDFELNIDLEAPSENGLRYYSDETATDWCIDTTEFDNFLKRFGPFSKCMQNAVSSIFPVDFFGMPAPWFHGTLSTEQVEVVMERNKEPGMFMVTYDPERVDGFLLHFSDARGVHKKHAILKQDIPESPEKQFVLVVEDRARGDHADTRDFSSLHELITTLQREDTITDFVTSHVYYRLDERLARSKTVLGGDAEQMTLADIRKLLEKTCRNADGVEKAAVAQCREKNAYSVHVLYWIALCRRLKNLLEETKLNVRRALARQAQTAIRHMNERLRAAASKWKQGKYYAEKNQAENIQKLSEDEAELYEIMIELGEALSKHDRLPISTEHDTLRAKQRRMFWYRFFGPTESEIPIETFGAALTLFLQSDFSRVDVNEDIVTKVIRAAGDENADGKIQLSEWTEFLDRFGPLEECYDRAKCICTYDDAGHDVELVNWFRFKNRKIVERLLTNHEKGKFMSLTPYTHFYIRHGQGGEHAFSFTFRPKPEAEFSHIRIINKYTTGKHLYQIGDEPTDRTFSTLTELVRYIYGVLKWPSAPPTLQKWDLKEQEIAVANESEAVGSSETQMNKFIDYLVRVNLATKSELQEIIPEKARSLGEQQRQLQVLDSIMSSKKPSSLEEFKKFCNFGGQDGRTRQSAVKTYRRGRIGLEVVERAIRDEDWIDALELVAAADPKLLSNKLPVVYRVPKPPKVEKRTNALGIEEDVLVAETTQEDERLTPAQLAIRQASRRGWIEAKANEVTLKGLEMSSACKNMRRVLELIFQKDAYDGGDAESDHGTEIDFDEEKEDEDDEESERGPGSRRVTFAGKPYRQWSNPLGFVDENDLYDLFHESVIGLNKIAMESIFEWSFHGSEYADAKRRVKDALLNGKLDGNIFHVMATLNDFSPLELEPSVGFPHMAEIAQCLMDLLRQLVKNTRQPPSKSDTMVGFNTQAYDTSTYNMQLLQRAHEMHGSQMSLNGERNSITSSPEGALVNEFLEQTGSANLTPVMAAATQRPANKELIIKLVGNGQCNVEHLITVSNKEAPGEEHHALLPGSDVEQVEGDNLLHLIVEDKTWWEVSREEAPPRRTSSRLNSEMSDDENEASGSKFPTRSPMDMLRLPAVKGRFTSIVNKSNVENETPLCSLVSRCVRGTRPASPEIVVWLLEQGASADSVVDKGHRHITVLQDIIAEHMASSAQNNWKLMKTVLENGDSALLGLTIRGSLPVKVPPIMFDVKKGKDRKKGERKYRIDRKESLLHYAVGKDSKASADMVKVLLDYRPERTEMADRLRKECPELFRTLRSKSLTYAGVVESTANIEQTEIHSNNVARLFTPDPEFFDNKGRTALHILARRDPTTMQEVEAMASALLQNMPANQKDFTGMAPLHYASLENNDALVKALIERQVDASQRCFIEEDHDAGSNPIPSENRVAGAGTNFSKKGASGKQRRQYQTPKTCPHDGNMALHLAARAGHWAIVQRLMKESSPDDANVHNNEGFTPLSLALQRKRYVELLLRLRKQLQKWKIVSTDIRTAPGAVHLALLGSESAKASDPEEKVKGNRHSYVAGPSRDASSRRMIKGSSIEMSSRFKSRSLRAVGIDLEKIDARLHIYYMTLQDAKACKLPDPSGDDHEKEKSAAAARAAQVFFHLLKTAYKKRKPLWKSMVNEGVTIAEAVLICESEDLQRVLRDYDTTINLMKKHKEVSIDTATKIPGVDEVINVEDEWEKMYGEIENEGDGERSRSKNVMKVEEDAKRKLWEDKLNQAIIRSKYEREVKPVHFVRFWVYVCFLLLLTAVGIRESTRDSQSAYYLHRAIFQTLIEDEFPDRVDSRYLRNFENIDEPREFYLWLNGTFLDVLYPEREYEWKKGQDEPEKYPLGYINSHTRLLGVPRLRQLRGLEEDCDVPDSWKEFVGKCVGPATKPDRSAFGEGGKWTFSEDAPGVSRWGQTAWYPDSGHVVLLPSPFEEGARQRAQASISDLSSNNFIDVKTRAIFVEFSAYNANENHFLVVTALVEFPRAGGVVVSQDISIQKLKRNMDRGDIGTLAVDVIFLFVVVLLLFGWAMRRFAPRCCCPRSKVELHHRKNNEKPWLYPEWKEDEGAKAKRTASQTTALVSDGKSSSKIRLPPVYDLLSYALHALLCAAVILHFYNLLEEEDVNWSDTTGFVPVQIMARRTKIESQLLSLAVFLAWFKILDHMSVFKKQIRLVIMIEMMVRDLVNFIVLLFIVLVAFASAEYIAYGYKMEQSSTWLYTFITRISYTFSGREIQARNDEDKVLNVVYPMMFVIIVGLLFMNLLIAILATSYKNATEEAGDAYWAKWQYEMIAEYKKSRCRWPEDVLLKVYRFVQRPVVACCYCYAPFGKFWYCLCCCRACHDDDDDDHQYS